MKNIFSSIFLLILLSGCSIQMSTPYVRNSLAGPIKLENTAILIRNNVAISHIDGKVVPLYSDARIALNPDKHTITAYAEKENTQVKKRVVLEAFFKAQEVYSVQIHGDQVWVEDSQAHRVSRVKSFSAFKVSTGL